MSTVRNDAARGVSCTRAELLKTPLTDIPMYTKLLHQHIPVALSNINVPMVGGMIRVAQTDSQVTRLRPIIQNITIHVKTQYTIAKVIYITMNKINNRLRMSFINSIIYYDSQYIQGNCNRHNTCVRIFFFFDFCIIFSTEHDPLWKRSFINYF